MNPMHREEHGVVPIQPVCRRFSSSRLLSRARLQAVLTSLILVVSEVFGPMDTQHGNNIVGAYQAKTHLSELLEKVEAGEEITITKHGAPVAKLVPVKKEVRPEERVAAIDRIQKLATDLSLGGLKVKDLIREGRR